MDDGRRMKPDTDMLPSFDDWLPDPRANYGGSDRKDGLLGPDGSRYMVKFSEKKAPQNGLGTSYVNNVVSEYVCSHIFGILGYPVHDTELGTLNGELVVACRNFVQPGVELVEFEKFLRKHYDSGDVGRIPNIRQVYDVLENDRILALKAEQIKSSFWMRFVGDALVGNADRFTGDFGYLVDANGSVEASPLYDNGGTLFPDLSEVGMETVLEDPKEILLRVRLFPKAALEFVPNVKVDYYDMMASGLYDELTDAVVRVVPHIRDTMPAVMEFINGCDFLSDTRKAFYTVMLAERLHFILEPAYELCATRRFDLDARRSVENGTEYGVNEFEQYWKFAQFTDGSVAAAVRDKVMVAWQKTGGLAEYQREHAQGEEQHGPENER